MSNAIGNVLPLSGDELGQLSGILSDALGFRVEIDTVNSVSRGISAGMHFVARTKSGQLYGIKSTKRGSNEYLVREQIAAALAVRLAAPNAVPIIHLEPIPFLEELNSRCSNLSEWMADGQTFADLFETDQHEQIAASDAAMSLFQQFGEWMCFGLVFGIRDRTDENWVWSIDREKLAMIDFEHAFESPLLNEYYSLFMFQSSDVETFERQTTGLSEGYGQMWARCIEQEEQIARELERLPASGFPLRLTELAPNNVLTSFLGAA